MNIAIQDAVRCVLRKKYCWMNTIRITNYADKRGKLYSYALKIGTTTDDHCKNVLDYTARGLGFYSVTTSTHVGMAKKYADIITSTYIYASRVDLRAAFLNYHCRSNH